MLPSIHRLITAMKERITRLCVMKCYNFPERITGKKGYNKQRVERNEDFHRFGLALISEGNCLVSH